MQCSYHPGYQIPVPANHPPGSAFPATKSELLKDRLLAEGVLNDVAVAVTKLRDEGAIERALIIDLDVHQGNGTAAIFENVAAGDRYGKLALTDAGIRVREREAVAYEKAVTPSPSGP